MKICLDFKITIGMRYFYFYNGPDLHLPNLSNRRNAKVHRESLVEVFGFGKVKLLSLTLLKFYGNE